MAMMAKGLLLHDCLLFLRPKLQHDAFLFLFVYYVTMSRCCHRGIENSKVLYLDGYVSFGPVFSKKNLDFSSKIYLLAPSLLSQAWVIHERL